MIKLKEVIFNNKDIYFKNIIQYNKYFTHGFIILNKDLCIKGYIIFIHHKSEIESVKIKADNDYIKINLLNSVKIYAINNNISF